MTIPGSQVFVAGGALTVPTTNDTILSGKQSVVACARACGAPDRATRKIRTATGKRADRAMAASLEAKRPRGQVSWLAAVYSPALPRSITLPVGFSGFRYRSQLRGSGGFTPPSLFNHPGETPERSPTMRNVKERKRPVYTATGRRCQS